MTSTANGISIINTDEITAFSKVYRIKHKINITKLEVKPFDTAVNIRIGTIPFRFSVTVSRRFNDDDDEDEDIPAIIAYKFYLHCDSTIGFIWSIKLSKPTDESKYLIPTSVPISAILKQFTNCGGFLSDLSERIRTHLKGPEELKSVWSYKCPDQDREDCFSSIDHAVVTPLLVENQLFVELSIRLVTDEPIFLKKCTETENLLEKSQTGTDIELQFEYKTIKMHRYPLMVESPVFYAMFTHPMKEQQTSVINLKHIPYKTMKVIIHWCYVHEFNISSVALIMKVYQVAEMYQMQRLQQACVDSLCSHVSINDAPQVLIFAEQFSLQDVLKTVKSIIVNDVDQFSIALLRLNNRATTTITSTTNEDDDVDHGIASAGAAASASL